MILHDDPHDFECRSAPDCRLSQVVEGPITFLQYVSIMSFPFMARHIWTILHTETSLASQS